MNFLPRFRCLATLCLVFACADVRAQTRIIADTGQVLVTAVDALLPGPLAPLELSRTYRSFRAHHGLFGRGWCSPFEDRIDPKDLDHELLLHICGDEEPVPFAAGENGWTAADGRLIQRSGVGFVLRMSPFSTKEFNRTGQLSAITTLLGPRLVMGYREGRLVSVSAGDRRRFELTTDEDGLVRKVQIGAKVLSYSHQAGRLVAVRNFWGNDYRYLSNPDGLLTKIEFPDKTTELFSYDSRGRLTSHTNRFSCEEKLLHPGKAGKGLVKMTKTCGQKVVATQEFSTQSEARRMAGETHEIWKGSRRIRIKYDSRTRLPREIELLTNLRPLLRETYRYHYLPNGLVAKIERNGLETFHPVFDARGGLKELRHQQGSKLLTHYRWDSQGRSIILQDGKRVFGSDPVSGKIQRSPRRPASHPMAALLRWNEALSLLEIQ